jgi:molybdopterin molybdotransferase
METMISAEKALALIREQVQCMDAVVLPLEKTFGLALAEDVVSSISVPSFVQSNMDGYAFAYEEGTYSYEITGEVAAGQFPDFTLQRGEAIRIFTGAPLPNGADTVVMQEKVQVVSGRLILPEEGIHKGEHVRLPGSEIAAGTVLVEKGTIISPAAAGMIASVGVQNIKVYPKPKVGILVTGNELQRPGQRLEKGQIYESNSYTLLAALHQLHMEAMLANAKDDPEEMESQISTLLQQCDLVLITGGVSVGTYDYTRQALENCGVSIAFHKVRQKPGKPLLFGMKETIPVFGLPGNPGSVLTCFYEYVSPAIERLTFQKCALKSQDAPLSHDISKPRALTCFFKGYFDGKTATVLSGQESFKMASYNQANCLIMVPEEINGCMSGDLVKIHLIPGTHHPQ